MIKKIGKWWTRNSNTIVGILGGFVLGEARQMYNLGVEGYVVPLVVGILGVVVALVFKNEVKEEANVQD